MSKPNKLLCPEPECDATLERTMKRDKQTGEWKPLVVHSASCPTIRAAIQKGKQ
jgi:hypothetical protein